MWNYSFKALSLTALALTLAAPAQANDRPIEILLKEVSLDLSNPDATANRVIDKDFKSNDPSIRSRIYKLNDGTRVKLVGRDFDKVSSIDKIRVTYPHEAVTYNNSEAALIANFGAPSKKRPGIFVWSLDNTTQSSTQSKTFKIIAIVEDAKKRTITINRQRGGRGNNPRRAAIKAPLTSSPSLSLSAPHSANFD